MWKFLIEKEFKQFFRDPGLPKMAIAFPILMMLVFPFAVSMEIRNISLAVVDNDRSKSSAAFVNKCISSGYFRLEDLCSDPAIAQTMMDNNEADAIITIGEGFEKAVGNGSELPVGVKINTVNGTKGSIGAQYIASCIRAFTAESKVSSGQRDIEGGQIVVTEKFYFNPYMDYKAFMIPALIVIAITMVTGFFPALNIVGEKESGTIEQINVTPVKRSTFIICKLVPYWSIAFFILGACLLLSFLVFGFSSCGGIWPLFLFTGLHIIVTAGLGILISNYSENAQQAMFIIWFFMMVFMLMSGIFTPVASMPEWAQGITYLNPMRYYADAMRSVFLKGSTPLDVWYDAAGLICIGSVVISCAILSYKKTNQ